MPRRERPLTIAAGLGTALASCFQSWDGRGCKVALELIWASDARSFDADAIAKAADTALNRRRSRRWPLHFCDMCLEVFRGTKSTFHQMPGINRYRTSWV